MSPIDTVQSFVASWRQNRAAINDSVRRYLAPDCIYENVGLSRTCGPEEAIAFFDQFATQIPFESIDVTMLAIATQGDTVLTERIDDIKAADGTTLVSLRVMGIFKLHDGKIHAWRDYFDTAPFATR
ncbi:MAG: limonene-1,2-epoxide hydrolase [Nevskiaceae bacterium]|nr:MAG: limonene-1,2-epoxide hydrolase [Nevskiaceae bacterium]TBR71948.1 MAG: limonene-1,2-epoxide hydrolase [Nevskiaceae bacterium]